MSRDRRYKVDKKMIASMRQMRLLGNSYQKIADEHGVSYYTAYYWINDEERAAKRAKNAKRRHSPGDKARVQRDMAKRRENWNENPDSKLRHTILSAKGEKRVKRKTVKGMSMSDAEKLLRSGKLDIPNNKMGE